jgi:hypothetical protein
MYEMKRAVSEFCNVRDKMEKAHEAEQINPKVLIPAVFPVLSRSQPIKAPKTNEITSFKRKVASIKVGMVKRYE